MIIYCHNAKVLVIRSVHTASNIWGCNAASSLHLPQCLQLPGGSCLWQRRGQSSFSFTWDTLLQWIARLQGDLGQQCTIWLLVLPTAKPLNTTHIAADCEFWLGDNRDLSCEESRKTDKSHEPNCPISPHQMYHCQPVIVTCARTTIGSGYQWKDQSLRTDMYSKGYNGHLNPRIGHISRGKELFGVMNAQWKRVIQGGKCRYFNNHLKSGSKTALHQNERAKQFPWWFGVLSGAGTVEPSPLLFSNQSTRVSMSSFLSTFFFQSLHVSMTP